MRRNKKKNLYVGLLIIVLMLGIGFAALNTTLKIDGTLNVARTSWDVHFENVQVTTGSVTASPAPTTDGTTTTEMAYTINFTKPGDFYEFTVDMVNDGTIDAMVDVVENKTYASNGQTEIELPSYLTSSVMYNSGVPIQKNQLLAHGTSEKIKVRIEFKKDISASDLPSNGDTTIVFKFKGDYKQADENAISILTARWDGTTEAITPDGNTYKIYNPEQLAWVSEQVNSGTNSFEGKQLLLMNDINMGAFFDNEGNLLDGDSHPFTPIGKFIGKLNGKFEGDFDGQNHTIYNLYINRNNKKYEENGTYYYEGTGLFAVVDESEIKNFTLADSYIKADSSVGVIGGGRISETGVGYVFQASFDVENVKSINNIIIADNASAGGVVASVTDGTINNCYSNSTVISKSSSAGGIVVSASNSTITNNINDGSVTSSGLSTGGIIGFSGNNALVSNNINNGTVIGETKWIGGIVGYHGGSVITTYSNNINNGDVKSSKGAFRVGGIIGNANKGIVVVNNVNYGNIDGVGNGTSTSYGVGGIVGTFGNDDNTDKNSWIYNCYNKGNVKGGQSAGGIVGDVYRYTQPYVAIKNIINEGTVETTSGYSGGIVGSYSIINSADYVADLVTNAYNKGTVKGTYAAGLVGRNIGIKDSITLGTLQGTNNFGVIANAPAGVNITNVYYPNTYTSSYGTAVDPSTVTDTTLRNLLGNGFKVNNGTVQLYKANVTIENGEVTSCTYSNEVVE